MKTYKKILMIETGGWGGICHYTYNLANEVAKNSVYNIVVISGEKYELEQLPRAFQLIHHFNTQQQGYYKNLLGIIPIIKQSRPVIIHIQSILRPRRDVSVFLLLKCLNIPIIYTMHNLLPHDIGEKDAVGIKFAFKLIYKSVNHLIVHSEANKKELMKAFNINYGKISIIPHGDYTFILPKSPCSQKDLRKELDLEQSGKVILCFGAIRRYKGIDFLIQAFSEVVKEIPHSRLLIVGKSASVREESPINEYKKMVKEYKLESKVQFRTEYIPLFDIYKYFIAADVAVYPYTDTTESGALQLALACSRPIIATDVGSFKQAIESGKNGYLVPPGDVRALVNKIITILNLDARQLQKLGNHAREIAHRKYNWERIADKTIKLYMKKINN